MFSNAPIYRLVNEAGSVDIKFRGFLEGDLWEVDGGS
jgi:hypothetical protein